jgi:hypothetical protein
VRIIFGQEWQKAMNIIRLEQSLKQPYTSQKPTCADDRFESRVQKHHQGSGKYPNGLVSFKLRNKFWNSF